jgi:hypothetical protein
MKKDAQKMEEKESTQASYGRTEKIVERALLVVEMSVNNFGSHYDFQFVDYVSTILLTRK